MNFVLQMVQEDLSLHALVGRSGWPKATAMPAGKFYSSESCIHNNIHHSIVFLTGQNFLFSSFPLGLKLVEHTGSRDLGIEIYFYLVSSFTQNVVG